MTDDDLLSLALRAIEDDDARSVYEDAWQESGKSLRFMWNDSKNVHTMHARAYAAETLFALWPTRWELAERCRRPTVDGAVDWPLLERFFGSLLPE